MPKAKKKLVIIDGNALIHRSFHALPPTMKTADGTIVNAVYGFTSFLLKAWLDIKPDYIVLTLDEKGPTFRHKEYDQYKATRVKAPDELYAQMPIVRKVAQAFNIPTFSKSGFEADDLIGTICNKVNGQVEKIIITGDLDTLQLVNDSVSVYTMSRGLSDSFVYHAQEVRDRFDLEPSQMIDYKALRGDPSDNIPGVKGIGEKGAIELIKEFGSLDNLYQNIESPKIKDRTRKLLSEQKKEAYLSQKLGRIKLDVDLNFKLEDTKADNFSHLEVLDLLQNLEFNSLIPRAHTLMNSLNLGPEPEESGDKFERDKKLFDYRLIENEKEFKVFLKELKKQKIFAFDTECSSLDPMEADILGISFSWQAGQAYYLKLGSSKNNLFNYQEGTSPLLKGLASIFADKDIKKVGHNLKFDLRVLQKQGLEVAGLYFDTMIASYLLNPDTRQHNLDALSQTELNFNKIKAEDLIGQGRDRIGFSEVALDKLYVYACEDADCTFKLFQKLEKRIKNQKLYELMQRIEMPLITILANMENNGILLDTKLLAKMKKELSGDILKLEKEIYKQADLEFNINSTKQLKEVLFDQLQIPSDGLKKTKTGISTASDELDKIKEFHPIISLIQQYRELTKLVNTYIDSLPELINPRTKRIHASFNQTVAATGRLSSNNPNLQNIPTRTATGKKIRQAFVAAPGYKILSLDYSQIELRLAAHMSNDKKMIQAFQNNIDIHQATAAEINGVELNQVTSKMRYEAKAVNFGILYGQGPHGLSQGADIPYAQAKAFIDKYFEIYDGIKKMIDETIAEAREKGYVSTLFKRRRYLPDLNANMMQIRKSAERMAVNAPIQGTAADMIKMAMIKIYDLIKDREEIRMLIQVHDELIFEVKEDKLDYYREKIKNIMEEIIQLKVPVIVDSGWGNNWGEIK